MKEVASFHAMWFSKDVGDIYVFKIHETKAGFEVLERKETSQGMEAETVYGSYSTVEKAVIKIVEELRVKEIANYILPNDLILTFPLNIYRLKINHVLSNINLGILHMDIFSSQLKYPFNPKLYQIRKALLEKYGVKNDVRNISLASEIEEELLVSMLNGSRSV